MNLGATSGNRQVTLTWETPSIIGASDITHYEYQQSLTDTLGDSWITVNGGESIRQITVVNLIGGTTYYFRVRAVNSQGVGEASPEVDVTPYNGPGVPTNLGATSGNRQVTLNWEAPSDTGDSDITRYEYQQSLTDTFGSVWIPVGGGGSVRQVTVASLTGGTTYSFRVRAVNSQGAGEVSPEVDVTPYNGPGVPTDLGVTSGNRQVMLSWEAPSDTGDSAITHYEYQQSLTDTFGSIWTSVIGGESVRQVTVFNLTGGTTYYFRVRAVNSQGEGDVSPEVDVTLYNGPGAPTDLGVTSGNRQVMLSWEAPSDTGDSDITHYEYQQSLTDTFGSIWVPVIGGESMRQVTIFNLTGGTTYYFRVRAVNSQGEGEVSTEVDVTPYNGPGAPTNLGATSGNRQITLTWETPSIIGASDITHYEYQQSLTDTFDDPWITVGGGESIRQVTVASLTGATTYFFRVRAVSAQGVGEVPTEVSAIAYDGSTPEPEAPTNLGITAGNRQVTLTWGAPSAIGGSAITHYEYQQSLTDTFGDPWTPVEGGEGIRQVTVVSLTGGTTYYFRVRAVNSQGEGASSTEVNATTYGPGAPTNLGATSGNRQVTLTWEAPSSAIGGLVITHYEYQQSLTDTFGSIHGLPLVGGESVRQVTVASLTGGTTYYFRVRAVNTQSEGAPSIEVGVTPYNGPRVPTDLRATSGDHQVTLNWEAPSDTGDSDITRYEYQQSLTDTFNDSWTPVDGGGSIRQVTVANLTSTTTYFFRVRAVNSQGVGEVSTEVSAVAYDGSTPEPGPPTNLRATSADHQVTLNWGASSTIGASDIIRYEYQYKIASSTFGPTWTPVSNWESALEVTIFNLTGATTYSFRVRAVNTQGGGMPEEIEAPAYDGPIPEPGPPTNLRAIYGDRQVTLHWEASLSAGASPITHYEYRYRTTSSVFGEIWTPVLNWESALEITISGLTGETTYHFQVRAVNAQGAGMHLEMSATPYDGPSNPEAACNDPEATDSALHGLGTAEEPFVLCSPAHLSLIGTGTSAAYTLSASYVMGQDIDLNNASFTPLTGAFTGTLDGNGIGRS